MLTYVRKFTYLTAAKNSNKGYLTYGKVNIKSEKSLLSKEFITQARLFYALSLDKVINGTLDVRSSTYNNVFCEIICHSVIILRKWLMCRNIME